MTTIIQKRFLRIVREENANIAQIRTLQNCVPRGYTTDTFYFACFTNTNYMITIKQIFSVGHKRKLTPLFIFFKPHFERFIFFSFTKTFHNFALELPLTGGRTIYQVFSLSCCHSVEK